MNYGYKDNYPHNIEAPQRVNFQYSCEVKFDYSTGKYPLGEEYEGFIWEEVYIPVEHYIEGTIVSKHVWMRTSVGSNGDWTLPIRLTDSFTNIEQSDVVVDETTGQSSYRIKYTLTDGSVVYSDPIIVKNGTDGVGISQARIINDDLVIDYSNGVIDNLGRVTGLNGTGIPVGAADYDYIVSIGNIISWRAPILMLNENLSAVAPIVYNNGEISHLLTDGNKHIPAGGNTGDALITDGIGNHSWFPLTDPINGFIPWSAIDPNAGLGDTDKLYSADKIMSLVGSAAYGIRYSVNTIVEMNAITGMIQDELCVVNDEPNRPVYKYDAGNWVSFFDLDALHDHDNIYYRSTALAGSGGTAPVHWNNITNEPSFLTSFGIAGDSGSGSIIQGETLSILGGAGTSVAVSGNTVTITSAGTAYSAGAGLSLLGTVFSHANTSSIGNINNSNGIVIQDLSFDTYGHVISQNSVDLDGRYSLLGHTHTLGNLIDGNGINDFSYNGTAGATISVAFGGNGSANTVSRSDHTHAATGLNIKTIALGAWNMDALGSVSHAHGLDASKIVSVSVGIVHDSSPTLIARGIEYTGTTGIPGGYWTMNSSNIGVLRVLNGVFDDAQYDATTHSRGWITIWYTD